MKTASPTVRRMDQAFYPDFENGWDDKRFRGVINQFLRPDAVVLDFGAGRGNVAAMNVRGQTAKAVGVDVDRAVLENPFLDESRVIDPAAPLPFESKTFDLVFSDNVMEHVDDPVAVFSEIHRVLKPGGHFLAKTPNKTHYMPMVARLTPHRFHRWYNGLRGRAVHDTFPTRYRINTRGAVSRLASAHGFHVDRLETWEGRPEYLRILPITYLAGLVYERVVNSTEMLAGFRCVLMFVLRKPEVS